MGEKAQQEKFSLWGLCACFMAYACSITATPNGAIAAEGSTFAEALGGIIVAWAFAAATCGLVCYVTYKAGFTKDVVFRVLFGKRGFLIASLFFAFCQNFWASYDIFNAGQGMYNLMPEGPLKNMGFCIGVCIILILTVFGGVKGVTGVKWISTATIPVAVALFAAIFIASVNNIGGLDALTSYQPKEHNVGLLRTSQSMYAMWMAGYIGCSDLAVPAKSGKHIAIAAMCFAAMIFLCYLVGITGFIGTGFKTVGDICLSLGGAIFFIGNVFVIVAQCNTQPACCYMYALSYAEIFRTKRKWWAVFMPMWAAAVAFYIMYGAGVDFINNIVGIVSTLMGPINGVIIGEFFLVRKCKFEYLEDDEIPTANWTAVCVMIGGAILAFFFNNSGFPFPAPIIVGGTCVIHAFLRNVCHTK